MSNFSFLKDIEEYQSFANVCIEAEELFYVNQNVSAIRARTALELVVDWVYEHDYRLKKPEQYSADNLYTLINNDIFKNLIGANLSRKINKIRLNGNNSVHTGDGVSANYAGASLSYLFDFIQWVDKNYRKNEYVDRYYRVDDIPINGHLNFDNDNNSNSGGTLSSILKVGGGIVIGAIAAMFLSNKDNN